MTTSRAATDNAATVSDIYAAFGRGDLPGILDRISEDVVWDEWEDNFAQRAGVPHIVQRRGRDGVAAFIAVLADYTIQRFDVLDIIGNGRKSRRRGAERLRHAWRRPVRRRAAPPLDLR
jgi:uncharacterized protein